MDLAGAIVAAFTVVTGFSDRVAGGSNGGGRPGGGASNPRRDAKIEEHAGEKGKPSPVNWGRKG